MEREERFQDAKAILARYVQENRMRNTPERLAILEMFYMEEKEFTPQQVFETMKERFAVSRATVYNCVQLLYKLGLIIRLEVDNQIKYQACFGEREYFRTVCTRCGKMRKFQAANLSAAFNGVKYNRFHPEQIVASVYGICSSCQSKATRLRKKLEKEDALKELQREQNKRKN